MPVTQPAGAVRTLAQGTFSDQVISPDGKTVFIARNGTIAAYDLASGQAQGSWNLGTTLGGIDVSPDGRYLVAPEWQAGPTTPDGPSFKTEYYVYRLDTQTGTVAKFTSVVPAYGSYYYDASFLSDGKVLLSQEAIGSAGQPLTLLDPASGAFTASDITYAQAGVLDATADRSTVVLTGRNSSGGPILIYETGQGVTALLNQAAREGVLAISNDGKLVDAGGTIVRDENLQQLTDLGPLQLNPSGAVFSPSGDALYLLDAAAREVFKVRVSDWTVVAGYPVGSAVRPAGSGFGNELAISADGRFLSILGDDELQVIDLTKAVSDTGTPGNDVLTGDAEANVIYGFAGNDVLDGGANPPTLEGDVLYGGPGDDTYYLDSLTDSVVERENDGYDTVYTSVGYQSTGNIEKIVLTGTAQYGAYAQTVIGNDADNGLTGTELDDLLIGNGGNDQLAGQQGKDRMEGGKGDDTYFVDNVGDQPIELPGEGTDTVYATIDYILPDNVENLTLSGYSDYVGQSIGTGNAAGNVITGSPRGDKLEGLAGNDLLVGDPYGWSTAGPDTLLGGDGDDTLLGAALDAGGRATDDIGSEHDTMSGGNGDDAVWAGAGDDADGGAGSDTLNLSLAAAAAGVTIATSAIIGAGTTTIAGGKLSGFEALGRLRTTELADDITIDSAVTTLAAGAGNDVIKVTTTKGVTVDGGLGNDLFFGGAGNDSFDGSAGEDVAQFRGNRGDYKVVLSGPQITVTDLRTGANDGTDTLTRVETLRFADGDVTAIALLNPPLPDDWRLFAPDLFQGQVGGSGTVYGTTGQQIIRVLDQPGTVAFDPSFNRGGDFIRLDGKAAEWGVVRSGSNALFTDGDTFVTVPFSLSATQMVFDDGYRALRVQPNGVPSIGAQSIGTTLTTIGAPPSFTFPDILEPDPAAKARLFLAAGADLSAAGIINVFGTNGAERLVVLEGNFVLDPSFNRGADTVVIEGDATGFTAQRQGSGVFLDGAKLDLFVPVGTAGTTLEFNGGDTRELLFDAAAGSVHIGDQIIGLTPVALSAFA